jgi:hypothetical protein
MNPETLALYQALREWQAQTGASDDAVLQRVCGYAANTVRIANHNGNAARAIMARESILIEQLHQANQQIARVELDLALLRVQTQEVRV